MIQSVRVATNGSIPISQRPAATMHMPHYQPTGFDMADWGKAIDYAVPKPSADPTFNPISIGHPDSIYRAFMVQISEDWAETKGRMTVAVCALTADFWSDFNLAKAIYCNALLQYEEATALRAELMVGGSAILIQMEGHFVVQGTTLVGVITFPSNIGDYDRDGPKPEEADTPKIKWREFI